MPWMFFSSDINPCLKQEIDSQKLVVFTWLFPRTHTKNNLSCSVFPVKTKRLSFKTCLSKKFGNLQPSFSMKSEWTWRENYSWLHCYLKLWRKSKLLKVPLFKPYHPSYHAKFLSRNKNWSIENLRKQMKLFLIPSGLYVYNLFVLKNFGSDR